VSSLSYSALAVDFDQVRMEVFVSIDLASVWEMIV